MTTEEGLAEERYKAGFASGQKPLDSVRFPPHRPGHGYPRHYPQPHHTDEEQSVGTPRPDDALGEPLTIREVAALIGCSAWTVRHSYLPKGLPHLRAGPLGKLTFYRTQVVRWILERQKKGGK